MPTETLDVEGLLRTLQDRGWRWSGVDSDLLLHPDDHDFYLRYDRAANRLTLSPRLNAHLELIIPTPPSKSKVFVR
jgi:hypothetical protein